MYTYEQDIGIMDMLVAGKSVFEIADAFKKTMDTMRMRIKHLTINGYVEKTTDGWAVVHSAADRLSDYHIRRGTHADIATAILLHFEAGVPVKKIGPKVGHGLMRVQTVLHRLATENKVNYVNGRYRPLKAAA